MTLIELMIGVFIALFLTAAAVAFASHETRLLGYSNEKLDMEQSSRAAVDLLVSDLKMAGAGIGYCTTNIPPCTQPDQFLGVLQDNFAVPGGLRFNSSGGGHTDLRMVPSDLNGAEESGNPYILPTEDLLLMMADGAYATIANWTGSGGEYCNPGRTNFTANEQVLIRSEDTIVARSGSIIPGVARPCSGAPTIDCAGGCRTFNFTAGGGMYPVRFNSETIRPTDRFTEGEIMGGFRAIAWFVQNAPDPDPAHAGQDLGVAQLRRVVFDGTTQCVGSRRNCGAANVVAENVETLQYNVWEWDAIGNAWLPIAAGQPILSHNRLRIDVEIVMRGRVADQRPHQPIGLRLRPGACVPGGEVGDAPPYQCADVMKDLVDRKAHRVSVEIKNSGRMRLGN